MLRPVKIRQYVEFMTGLGFDPRETLRGTRIDAGRLYDPGYLLDMPQCETVVSNMMRLTGNQGLALEIGAQADLATAGVVGQAMVTSPTLGEAIGHWVRYSNLVGIMIHHTLVEGPGREWTVAFSATHPMGFIYNFCVEEIIVSGCRLGAGLTRCPLVVKEVHLSYPAPLHAAVYRRHFDCPIHFNSSRSSITVRTPGLARALPGHDAELNAIYVKHCREVMRQIAGDDPVLTRIRAMFLASPHSLPDFDAVAARLGMSTRTLRRRLSEEGTCFRELVHRFRMDRVTELLGDARWSSKEIAGMVGFDEANSLRRAFKAWTGRTLGAHRKKETTPRRLPVRRRAGDHRGTHPENTT